jgi:hypothetical protein
VAIVQISRITQRKGLASDLPQPLAGAELGWATDDRRLFIGNGTIEDGAPVLGNTEVLTEFSDILGFATSYTYEGDAAGYTVQTGATAGSPVTQSIQRRLDSYAIVTDFGAKGDGITDDTAAINRALYQLYCREVNPQIRRSLFFPAGTYVITDTLNIPPFAYLYGEGSNSSIISFDVQTHSSLLSYAAGVLVIDSGLYYRSLATVPYGTLISNSTYWAAEVLPEYIARTADSLQRVGVNIAPGAGVFAPQNIEIERLAFVTNQVHNGFLWEKATQCSMDSVTIQGPLGTSDLIDAVDNTRAIDWSGAGSLVTNNVILDNCKYTGFTFATQTDVEIRGITFSNSNFDTLHQGIVLGDVVVVNGGATGVRVVQNTFNNIYIQGIVFTNVSRNISAYNIFYDVGNHFNGVALPASSIIEIDAANNASVGDMFERNNSQSVAFSRINLNNTNSMAMSMNVHDIVMYQSGVQDDTPGNALDLGTYQRTAGIQDTLLDNTTGGNIAFVTGAGISSIQMDYSIARADYRRRGTIVAVKGTGSTTTGFTYTDDYMENGSTGITLNVVASSGDIVVQYNSTSTGSNATIKYSISHFG